ncbi:hypothetical protein M3G50_07405 [Brachybacterium muris]|uniref:DUF7302 family protein n=1 Tax=Brachybacterium muris TaxID=219301 RepID=UPI0021A6B57A|nr:hypothetical protein [Brachybacterium muris]MCT1430579.1 hypothetical protein [Brachybacterium muris]
MKVTITRPAGGHAVGDTIEVNDQIAQQLIRGGVATEADEPQTEAKAEPKPKQTRRSQSRDKD